MVAAPDEAQLHEGARGVAHAHFAAGYIRPDAQRELHHALPDLHAAGFVALVFSPALYDRVSRDDNWIRPYLVSGPEIFDFFA